MPPTFPSRSDYETLIRRLDVFAADSTIKKGKVIMRKDGLFPQAYSGGRAVVFPVEISNTKYALKCWIQALGSLEERYKAISTLIKESKPPYLIESVYRENEILCNGVRYPVLQMQWSESLTLKDWISINISDPSKIYYLANRFLEVVADMHRIGMSHGDLQHENILVNPSTSITLVDYDSIFLPGLDHLDDEVKGLPGYQHSSRAFQAKANPKSDYISEYVIYITLIALSKKPELWSVFKDHNRLLFSRDDLLHPSSSDIFETIRGLNGLSELADAFEAQCLCSNLESIEPIEKRCFSADVPSPQRDINETQPRSNEDSQQATILGKPSDLRNARTWTGSNNANNYWAFDSLEPRRNGLRDLDKSCQHQSNTQAQYQSNPSSSANSSRSAPNTCTSESFFSKSGTKSNSQVWPSVITNHCSIESSLYSSQNTRKALISISFERTFLRFNCVSDDGKKSQLSVSKQRFVGWRRHNQRLELVAEDASGRGVIAIYTDQPSAVYCIEEIMNQLNSAGISADSIQKTRSSPTASSKISRPEAPSKVVTPTNEESNNKSQPPSGKYASDASIVKATGKSLLDVRNAASALGLTDPYTLLEYHQIILRLNKVSSRSHPHSNSNSSRVSEASKHQGSDVTDQLSESASAANLLGWTFSYATIADIAKCTDKSVADVRIAAQSIGVKPPFTLIEADRIAGRLVGDPSIRRAYSKMLATKSYEKNQSNSDCFVATAIYGDPHHPDLDVLRSFRDEVLRSSLFGRAFIYCYYLIGPGLSFLIRKTRLSLVFLPPMSLLVRYLSSLR